MRITKRNKRFGYGLAVLFALSILGLPQWAMGDNWVILGQNDDFAIYFERGSAKEASKTTYIVWTKVVAKTQSYKENILQSRRQEGLPIDGYENFAYRLDSAEIECSRGQYRPLSTSDYDASDHKLSVAFPISGWLDISPDTSIAVAAQATCRQRAESGYKWWDLP